MRYAVSSYDEGISLPEAARAALISRAKRFRLAEAPRRALSVEVVGFEGGPENIVRVTSTGHEIDVIGDDRLTVMLPMSGTVRVSWREETFAAEAGAALTFMPSARSTAVSAPKGGQFEAIMLKAPADSYERARAVAEPRLPRHRRISPLVRCRPATAASLRGLLLYIMNDLEASQATLRRLRAARAAEVLITEQLRTLMDFGEEPADGKTVPGNRIAAAEAFMEAHYADPLSVADIASACGLGVRCLQAAFQSLHGASPRVRLSEIRLDNAYDQLASGEALSVTEAALGCGFVHLGRFARGYHQRFGEFPSDTLRRRCGG